MAADIIIDKIQFKRGLKANMPILDDGEPFFCTDTKEHYIGTKTGNQVINDMTQFNQLVADYNTTKTATETAITTANTAAENANTKATELEIRVNQAIASGTVDLETKDARGAFINLKARLDSTDSSLAQMTNLNVINFTSGDSMTIPQKSILSSVLIKGYTNPTTFEGEKSHVLILEDGLNSSNFGFESPIELHGFSEIHCDTLSLTQHTQYIKKRVLTGTAGAWRVLQDNTDTMVFIGGDDEVDKTSTTFYTNRPYTDVGGGIYKGVKFVSGGNYWESVRITIPKNELISNDKAGLIQWLKDNPTFIIYKLTNPVITKTRQSDKVINGGSYTVSDTTHFDMSGSFTALGYEKVLDKLYDMRSYKYIINVLSPPIGSDILPFTNDGITDNYDAFVSLANYLKGGKNIQVYFPEGEYKIDRYTTLNSYIRYYDLENIEFSGYGAKIILKGDYHVDSTRKQTSVTPFFINSGENIKIKGFEIDGENYKMSVDSGYNLAERRSHLISISWKCNNIFLEDLKLNNSPVDGLYLGDVFTNDGSEGFSFSDDPVNKHLSNVYLKNVHAKNCGRQGMTIGVVQNLYAQNCSFDESGITNNGNYPGISPMAGVDIEPNEISGNLPEYRGIIKNLNFYDCKFQNNVNQQFTTQWSSEIEELNFYNCQFSQFLNPNNQTNLIGTLKTRYHDCYFTNVKVPMFAHDGESTHDEATYHYRSNFKKVTKTSNNYLMGSPASNATPSLENKILFFEDCKFILEKNSDDGEYNPEGFYIWRENPNYMKFINCDFITDSSFSITAYYMRGCSLINCRFSRFNYLESTPGEIKFKIDSTNVISDVLIPNTNTSVDKMTLGSQLGVDSTVTISGTGEFSKLNLINQIQL